MDNIDRIITYNFGENFIENLTGFLLRNFRRPGNDFSRAACVFGGRRPALFLRRQLSRSLKEGFIPPAVFSMDEFVDYVIAGRDVLAPVSGLDASFLIYNLAKKHIPSFLKGRSSFSEFLPWAREVVSFIEQLDLEDIDDSSLRHIEMSADIGYEIPDNINRLLQHLVKLRQAYHELLGKKNMAARGMKYLAAAAKVEKRDFPEFDAVIFCNFFYLHATEKKIIKGVYAGGKGICIFQGGQDEWSVLKAAAQDLGVSIQPPKTMPRQDNFSLYQAADLHAQTGLVRHILCTHVKNKDRTVIVLPRVEALIPLLSEVSSHLDEFNISMGYPLKRSSLYTLFDILGKTQESRKEDKYYTKDYLNLLRHPLVKNLEVGADAAQTRVIVHKIEELLQGQEAGAISGSIFLSLGEIEEEENIYRAAVQTLKNMGQETTVEACRQVLRQVHGLLFGGWENLHSFREFADKLTELLEVLSAHSMALRFPFNLKVMEKLYQIAEEFRGCLFKDECWTPRQIWEIFLQKLQEEKVSFVGSPLKGTQILGPLEVRSLNFENVIVMDMNEAVMPKLKIYEPLIPREVMLSLGINRLEKEEEIQRYQFMRFIAGARNVHLIYEEKQEKEKSRFIEELLWRKQRQVKKLEVVAVPRAYFSVELTPPPVNIKKTPAMLTFMKTAVYSASRLNTYLDCPLKFYYQYVLGLKEQDDLLEGPAASHIGTFIHQLLEDTFKRFLGRRPVINEEFKEYFDKTMEDKFEQDLARRMRADAFLLKNIIADRLRKFLDREARRGVVKIVCLEETGYDTVSFCGGTVNFKYTVDRIDQLECGRYVIIDYKSGGVSLAPRRLDALLKMDMRRPAIKENIKSFQLPLYYHFISRRYPHQEVNAQLYSIRSLEVKSFIAEDDFSQKNKIMEICLQALEAIFTEMFDAGIPFTADKDRGNCEFCPFGALCP